MKVEQLPLDILIDPGAFCHFEWFSTLCHCILWLYGKEQREHSVKCLLSYSQKQAFWFRNKIIVFTFEGSVLSSAIITCNISNSGSLMSSSSIVSGIQT